MKRYIMACIAVIFGVIMIYPAVSYAERIYCSTYNGVDYYIENTEKNSKRGLYEIGVYGSDGDHMHFTFRNRRDLGGWRYNIYNSRVYPTFDEWQYVEDNELANDVLYATLQAFKLR